MIETWLAAGAFAALATAMAIVGARRRRGLSSAEAAIDEFANRRRELRQEAEAHGLDGSAIAALEEELALEEIDRNDARASVRAGARLAHGSAERPPLLPLCAGALAVAAASFALYALWGEPHAETLAGAADLLDIASDGDSVQLMALEQALTARTQRRPEDGDGWFFLGHARMRLADYGGAKSAFAALRALTGANAQVDLALAQASYAMAGGSMDSATRALVDQALASNPQHPELLEILAVDALHRADYLAAARHLVGAMNRTPLTPRREVLAQTLALARARLSPERAAIEATVHVEGPAEPWLMVFARALDGDMPLAVVRAPTQATQTVLLDDAASMSDALPLSSAGLVEVVARVSATGSATAASAEAVSEPVNASERPRVTLTLTPPPSHSPDEATTTAQAPP